jgi:hypothetical protein
MGRTHQPIHRSAPKTGQIVDGSNWQILLQKSQIAERQFSRQKTRQDVIADNMASGLLPKSPVSSSLCDEVPHIFIQKSHLEPREFLISSAKRLLQHNRHLADNPTASVFVRY